MSKNSYFWLFFDSTSLGLQSEDNQLELSSHCPFQMGKTFSTIPPPPLPGCFVYFCYLLGFKWLWSCLKFNKGYHTGRHQSKGTRPECQVRIVENDSARLGVTFQSLDHGEVQKVPGKRLERKLGGLQGGFYPLLWKYFQYIKNRCHKQGSPGS